MAVFQAAWDWAVATPSFHAPALGFAISLLFTQLLKYLYPRRWREIQRRRVVIATAMALAAVPAFALFPTLLGAVEALIVAIVAPMSYYYGVRLLALKWPAVREALSVDPAERG